VMKALSWALRELAKKHPEEVRRFLDAHEAHVAARVQREVRNKIVTGQKNPRRGSDLVGL
jgi:3-methyladenine DNA glycosylase AlkD